MATALITGASEGIGLELARIHAAAKDDLVFCQWLANGLCAPRAGGGGIIDRAAWNSGG